jgi:hypothetical protein
VARAKRTDRAEARRRYRATLSDELPPSDLDDDALADAALPDAKASIARSGSRASAAASGPQPRPSVFGALRQAFRPTDFRGDLAALPRLLLHRAFLVPLALIVGLTAVVLVTSAKELISLTLVPYFIAPQPVAPVFLAGFLAPRASYLIGAILGVISWIALVVLASSPVIQQAAAGTATAGGLTSDVLVQTFALATIGGAFYAAAAAWYKRFLALANPNRAARAARTAGKPADRSRRRGSDDRPILARRR